MKTVYISENQQDELMDEMAYPDSFNSLEFKKINSFKGRVAYCENHLTRMSSGSSRIVYSIDNEKVLKLAKNQKGIAQNENEIELGTSSYWSCFADVYDYEENGLWLEMQKARRARKGDFKRILGIPFEAVCYYIDYYHSLYRPNPYGDYFEHEEYKEMVDSIMEKEEGPAYEFLYGVTDYMGNYQLGPIGDIKRISSWGVVSTDGQEDIVLIDFGLDDGVYNDYYKKW